MGYFLRQIDPGNQTPLHIILKSDETILGRSTFDELTKYKEVSRRHALVFKNIINGEDHWFVRDLKSLNGVFVNGVLIEHEQEIKIGDHIGLGVQGPSGFRCTLSLPPANQKKVLFIDITEDDPIFIKCEPIEDACVCGAQSDHPSTSSARQCTCISNCDSQNIKSCTGNDVSSGSKGNESSSINSTFQKCSDNNYADSFNNGRASVEKHGTSDSIWFSKDRFANKNTVLANSSSKIDNVEILPDSHSLKPPHIEVETDSNVEEKHSSFMKKNDPLTKDSSLSPFHGTKGGNFKARIEKNISSSFHPANEPLVKPSEQIPTISKRSEHVSTESDSVNNLERTRTETVPKLSKRGHYNMIVKNENQYESGSSNKQLQEEKNKMLANVKYAIGQETISAKNSVRKCHVPLVRCDSKHFKWPPGNIVKKIVIPQPVEENVSFKHLFSSCRSLSTETVLLEYNPKKSVPESTNVIFQHRLFINANTNNNIVNASVKHQAQDKDLSNNALTAGDGPSNLISSSISKSLSNLIINNQAPKPTSEIKSKPALVNVVSPYFITSSRSETVAANLTDSQELSNSNYGYSQVEDVIVISDDESYMDFNCSQLVIKEEPMEIESDIDSEEEIFGDLNKYEGSGDELALDDCDSFRKSQENIENIRKFIDSTSDTSIQVKQMAPSVDDTTEQNMDVFDYFPASQLNTYEDSESTSNTNEHINNNDDSDSDCDGNCLNIVKVPSIVFNTKDRIEDCDSSNGRLNQLSNTTNSKKRVSQIKSVGRTLLTLPKNMDRRPKYKRGREEWFEEKQLEDQAAIENRSMINPKTKKVNNKKPLKPRTPKKKSEKTPLERLYKKSNLDAYKIPKKPKTDASPKKDKRLPSTSSTLRKAEEAQSKISSFNRGDEHQRIQAAQKRKAPAIARTHGKVSRSESFLSDLQTNNARTAVPREKKTARKEVFKSSSTEKSNVNKQPLTSVNLMPPNRPLMHNQHLVPNKQGYRPHSFTHFSSNPPLSSKNVQAVNEPPQVQELTDNRNSTTAFDQPFHSEHLKNTLNLMQAAKFPKQVCPVPPSRVSSRDPRLARSMSSNSAPNTIVNPMLKYNNATFTSVAPSQPVVPNYCTGNQHPFVSKNNIQSQSFVNSAVTTYNKPLTSMFHSPPETSVRDSLAKQAHLWGMIKRIVELNVKWIEEQKNESEPPPDVRSGAANLPVCFSSPEEYITLFYSMLMLELNLLKLVIIWLSTPARQRSTIYPFPHGKEI
ncbi:hypothetical protein JTE90_028542 [Oedothorax gibbosus]|uniref:FHA domain-containing protein n=1 Tax=Oedothorax gibbosus TaxID=931172 RepID=A0AAV6VWC3_9ARAC|nr:hypothetical protein JTE90_028542 [Oedothorax gibbosus]